MIPVIFFFLVFIGMEFVAWFTHKYVMHGALWSLHKDHHRRDDSSFFEKNDYFFLIFAAPGIFLIMKGVYAEHAVALASGLAITVYGAVYFLVHDVFIHRRFKNLQTTNNRYLRGIRKAHKVHHKKISKEGGECFGMLVVPLRYFLQRKQEKNE